MASPNRWTEVGRLLFTTLEGSFDTTIWLGEIAVLEIQTATIKPEGDISAHGVYGGRGGFKVYIVAYLSLF